MDAEVRDGEVPRRIGSHRDLLVWRKAMALVELVYDLSDRFPPREEHRLTSQLIRAAISVAANIAEGQARATSKDFANFLVMAKASLMETDTHVEIALRRGYVSEQNVRAVFALIGELSKMLKVLRYKIIKKDHRH